MMALTSERRVAKAQHQEVGKKQKSLKTEQTKDRKPSLFIESIQIHKNFSNNTKI